MRKSYGQVSASRGQLRITAGFFHNVVFTAFGAVVKALVYAPFVLRFYTAVIAYLHLLRSGFYTLSTNLITKTISKENNNVMEAA